MRKTYDSRVLYAIQKNRTTNIRTEILKVKHRIVENKAFYQKEHFL